MPPAVRTALGAAAHTAIEHNYRQKIDSARDEPLDVVLDVYGDAFDDEVEMVERPEESVPEAKDDGVRLVKLHHRSVAPAQQPVYVEEQVQFEIGGHPYQTYIDAVTVPAEAPESARFTVRDLKTAQRTPSRTAHVLQLIAGAAGFRQKTGLIEEDVALDVLVRTKKEQHVPMTWGGPVEASAFRVLSQQIAYADEMVKAGNFPANGLTSQACSWCGFQSICPAYRAAFGPRSA